jgi:hypothetical protein
MHTHTYFPIESSLPLHSAPTRDVPAVNEESCIFNSLLNEQLFSLCNESGEDMREQRRFLLFTITFLPCPLSIDVIHPRTPSTRQFCHCKLIRKSTHFISREREKSSIWIINEESKFDVVFTLVFRFFYSAGCLRITYIIQMPYR